MLAPEENTRIYELNGRLNPVYNTLQVNTGAITRSTTERNLLIRRLFSFSTALILTPAFRLTGVSNPSPM